MSNMGASGGVSKVTPQSAIIINTSADTYDRALRRNASKKNTLYEHTSNEDDFCIARGEMCFAIKKQEQSTQVYGQNNPSVQVFTSANGLLAPTSVMENLAKLPENTPQKENAKEAIKRQLAKNLWFVGIAQGEKMKRDFENRSLALAVRVAGSDTIYNNGSDTIYPGDTIVWEMPPFSGNANVRFGEPRTKSLFTVKKYEYTPQKLKEDLKDINAIQRVSADRSVDACIIADSIQAMVYAVQKSGNNAVDEILEGRMEAFFEMFKLLNLYKQENYDRRIIGKALTEGKPGMHFDILLHHHHKIS